MKKTENETDASILRKKAEVILKKSPVCPGPKITQADVLKLVHELEVHQIELEMQNEELQRAKEREAELATEKYIELFDFAPSGYFTLSREGKILDLNLSGAKMLGKERSRLKGSKLGFFISTDTKPNFNFFLDKTFRNNVNEICEVTLFTNSNLPTYVHLSGIVKKNSEYCLLAMTDITERKQAEIDLMEKNEYIKAQNQEKEKRTNELIKINKELAFQNEEKEKRAAELIIAKEKAEESDRLKSAFLANMSHEIRTPMSGILGFAELLKQPGITSEQQHQYVRIIEKSGARMLNIINDIIDISKIESGQMNVTISETNVNEQIDFIYSFFKNEVEQKGMQLFVKKGLPENKAVIQTDREKIFAILTNLIKNAIKYSNKGIIEFGYSLIGSTGLAGEPVGLKFFVKDTGIGIQEDRQEAIFERFIQADVADIKAMQGAGLGLAIAKAYVEMLGGKIWVESKFGKGSVFFFTLPYHVIPEDKIVVENNENEVVDVTENEEPVNKLKILVAEDDEFSEMLITIAVEMFYYELTIVKTGVEAVETCRNNPDIDLILMDIKMPEMSGYEATRQIRQFNKNVVIIAQTAFGLANEREKAIESGCDDYISKPLSIATLTSLIKKYFQKHAVS